MLTAANILPHVVARHVFPSRTSGRILTMLSAVPYATLHQQKYDVPRVCLFCMVAHAIFILAVTLKGPSSTTDFSHCVTFTRVLLADYRGVVSEKGAG
jgi:hypothetical protein